MEFRIDTGMAGEVAAPGLRAALEASRDHFFKTQAELASSQIMATAPTKDPTPDLLRELGQRADAAKAAHLVKQATLRDLVALGIEQACAQAALFGGVVTASVTGHFDRRHRSGVHQRLVVCVDQVYPTADLAPGALIS